MLWGDNALTAALAAGAFFVRRMTAAVSSGSGTGEFRERESHGTEYTARVIVGGRDTFLVGNHVFACGNNELTGTHDPDNRENAERYSKVSFFIFLIDQVAVHCIRDIFRNVTRATAATATVVYILQNIDTQNNGVYCFCYCPLLGIY